jgi:dihydrofolate reductase
MGRKTFESLGRVLPNRKHVVITRNKNFSIENEMVEIVYEIKDIEKYINSSEECFVIGGASIYKMLMPFVKKMYITKIEEEFEADTYFPKIDEKEWEITEKEKGITDEKNPYLYEYIIYVRKK